MRHLMSTKQIHAWDFPCSSLFRFMLHICNEVSFLTLHAVTLTMNATPLNLAVLMHSVWKHWRKIISFFLYIHICLDSPHFHLQLGKSVGTSVILTQQHSLQHSEPLILATHKGLSLQVNPWEALKLLLWFHQVIGCRAKKDFLSFQQPHWVWSKHLILTLHRCDEILLLYLTIPVKKIQQKHLPCLWLSNHYKSKDRY